MHNYELSTSWYHTQCYNIEAYYNFIKCLLYYCLSNCKCIIQQNIPFLIPIKDWYKAETT